MKAAVVEVESLTKSFKDVRALDELSLKIESSVFGLIGPNGAGKTTLFRILLGLIRPDSGTVEILESRVDTESLHIRERLGTLHERPTYPGRMTPLQYLIRIRDIYGKGRDPQDILDIVGLSSATNRRISNLSSGMTQRLGIAQALIGQPDLVLLDEPTSNLDVVGREEIAQLILDLHENLGITFIVASHILSELERFCDCVAFIREGKILDHGKTLDLIDRYTRGCYRVTTDRPRQLAPELEKVSGVRSIRVTGVNAVTLGSDVEDIAAVEGEVRDVASHLELQIHSFYRANSLEDAYREVMTR